MSDVVTPLDVFFATSDPHVKEAAQGAVGQDMLRKLASLATHLTVTCPVLAGFVGRCIENQLDKQATAQLVYAGVQQDEYLARDWENGCKLLNEE